MATNWWRAAFFAVLALWLASVYRRASHSGFKLKPAYIIQDGGKPFDVNGSIIEYFEFGAPDGEPLLLMSGAAQTGRTWSMFDSVFRRHNLRVICPTLPGYGLTDAGLQRIWPDVMALLMTSLGYESFYLAGLSNGGFQAAFLASRYPSRVRALGVFSPGYRAAGIDHDPSLSGIGRFLMDNVVRTPVTFPLVALVTQNGLMYEPVDFLRLSNKLDVDAIESEAVRDMVFHDFRRAMTRTPMGLTESVTTLFMSELPAFDASTVKNVPRRFVLSGALDTITHPVQHRTLAAAIDAELVEYADEGHFAVFDHFEFALNKLLGTDSAR
eukprot:TRINITY_DN27478_c0_g1_i1.p1 TRINITY_DN27478_c0_g1~~TRINITY_DN27478_c0_g1_i1.p1  ORF type:complete len:326 (-),score=58.75 TRINITY_DN27478_c0_g1_i1:314-1291(-)